jgi:tetratricopeptide (TPR) repeat protein
MARLLAACAALALLPAAPAHAQTQNARPGDVRPGTFAGAILAAQTAAADRDLPNAIEFYRRALRFAPDNVEIKQQLLLALLTAGRFDESLQLSEETKTVAEAERYSRVALGIDAIRQRKYGDAEHLLKLALQNDLDRLLTGILSAWAKFGAGDKPGAVAAATALEGPDWYTLFRNLHGAMIAELGGDNAKAGELYANFHEDRASAGAAPEAWLRGVEAYATFLARTGKKDEALKVIAELDETSEGSGTLSALGARIEKGETLKPFTATPQLGASEMLYGIATALARPGSEDVVKLYLELARVLNPKGDAVLMQLASTAEQMQDAEGAIAFYEAIDKDSPVKRVAELQLGLNLADLKRNDEAKKHLAALVEQDKTDLRAYLSLGGVHAALEEYADAAKLYDRAVETIGTPKQEHWNLFYQRGIAYERIKQWDKAEPNFKKALELFPDQPQVLNYLGYSWVDMNIRLDEGLDLIRKAVELRPEDGYIVDSLGWAYYRLGRYKEAVEELERAVRLRPEDPTINDHLGDAYWRAGRKREAVFKWSSVLALQPEEEEVPKIEKKMKEGLADVKAEVEAPKQ